MSYDINSGEAKDKVRLLISDVGGEDASTFLYTNAEINAFLSLEGDSVYRAAAAALRAIANNEVQTAKAIKFLDISTDGAKVADSLNKLADRYEAKADEEEESDFDIAEMNDTVFAWRRSVGITFP